MMTLLVVMSFAICRLVRRSRRKRRAPLSDASAARQKIGRYRIIADERERESTHLFVGRYADPLGGLVPDMPRRRQRGGRRGCIPSEYHERASAWWRRIRQTVLR